MSKTSCDRLPEQLLAWYDRHARALPWRVPPGSGLRADPYLVWLSEIMLQQTTVAAVKAYFERFRGLWPTVEALAAADTDAVMAEWAGLGYYARARNLLKCARTVAEEHGGRFPRDPEALRALPGIGPYTAAAISAIAFDLPEVVMDGNVERVMARLHAVETPLPDAKPELKTLAARHTPAARPGDYAQAVMDLGATICTPRSPACGICPLNARCAARARGIAERLPAKRRKPAKPVRLGHVYVARTAEGHWIAERRPESGLLGGTMGWPGSTWQEAPSDAPPFEARWKDTGAEVRHTFTHFHLRLRVHVARVPGAEIPAGFTALAADFSPRSLPTVMRKVHALALAELDG